MESNELSKEEASKWLCDLGLAVSGTKQELNIRISKYKRYPNLVKKLRQRTNRNRSFKTSLNPLDIPPVKANWTTLTKNESAPFETLPFL